jgi:hypothetical protein
MWVALPRIASGGSGANLRLHLAPFLSRVAASVRGIAQERERERADKDAVIDDLRCRLDVSDEARFAAGEP